MSESPSDPVVDRIGSYPVRSSALPSQDVRPPALEIAVVRRDDGPDRATIHPPGLTGVARMETWLSTDCSAVVDLAAWR
jgi:hypothetical protein